MSVNKYLDSDGLRVLWNKIKEHDDGIVIYGYYLNGKFYKDSTYIETDIIPAQEHRIYIDLNNNPDKGYWFVYVYSSSESKYKPITVPEANSTLKGIMRLYNTTGTNEDGTMTQKSITEALNEKVYIDDEDEETLVITMFE